MRKIIFLLLFSISFFTCHSGNNQENKTGTLKGLDVNSDDITANGDEPKTEDTDSVSIIPIGTPKTEQELKELKEKAKLNTHAETGVLIDEKDKDSIDQEMKEIPIGVPETPEDLEKLKIKAQQAKENNY